MTTSDTPQTGSDNDLVDDENVSPTSYLSYKQKAAYRRQEQWLATFAETNSESAACEAVPCTLRIVQLWKAEDYLGFLARWTAAKKRFTDRIEAHLAYLALNTKPGQNPTPVLAILNAELPEKYRQNVQPTDDHAVTLLAELRKRAKADAEDMRKAEEQRKQADGDRDGGQTG